jgi:hypothetical protein
MGRKTEEIAALRKQAIVLLYQANPTLPLATIGEVFDCSRAYVSLVLREAGINAEDEKEVDVSQQLETLIGAYGTVQRVAKLLDISTTQLWRLRNGKSHARRELANKIIELSKNQNKQKKEK